jgi:hypothetical protein
MKGRPNEQQLRERIAYIHGRIERELEAFAATLALPPLALTARVGALLLGVEPGDVHHLSDVPLASGEGSGTVAEMEGAGESHGRGTRTRGQLAARSGTGSPTPHQVKGSVAQKKYWGDKTPEERSKEMARRRRKWSPEARAKWKGGGKKKTKARVNKQKLYQARHEAKKNGSPLPPLPKESEAA